MTSFAALNCILCSKLNFNGFTGDTANSRPIRQFEADFEGLPPHCAKGCLQFFSMLEPSGPLHDHNVKSLCFTVYCFNCSFKFLSFSGCLYCVWKDISPEHVFYRSTSISVLFSVMLIFLFVQKTQI